MGDNRERNMKGALKYLKVTAAGMLLASTGTAHMFDATLHAKADGPATDDQVSQLFESYDILNSKIFSDVYADFWAADSIRWAKSSGLVEGDQYGFFRPNDPMTEYQFATLLTQFYKDLGGSSAEDAYSVLERYRVPLMGYENEYYRNNPVTQGTVAQAIAYIQGSSADLESAVYYLFDEGVIVGDYTDGHAAYEAFGKTDSITNANAVVLFHRLDTTGKAKVGKTIVDLPVVDDKLDATDPVVDAGELVADAKDEVKVEAPNAAPVLPKKDDKVAVDTVASKGKSFKSTTFVTKKTATIRASANSKSKVVLKLAKGAKFSSSYRFGNYYKVTTRGKTGYIHSSEFTKYVAPKRVTMYAKKNLKVYSSTSTKSKSKGSLKTGNAVVRISTKGSWSQIKVGTVTGWVASRDLQTTKPVVKAPAKSPTTSKPAPTKPKPAPSKPAPSKPAPSKPKPAPVVTEKFTARAFTVTANLTVRSTYSASGKALTTIPNGTVIKSGERYNGWYKVTFNGKTGWVSGKYLTAYKAPTTTTPPPTPTKPKPDPKPEPKPTPTTDAVSVAKQVFGSGYTISGSGNEVRVSGNGNSMYVSDGTSMVQTGDKSMYVNTAKVIVGLHGGDANALASYMWDARPGQKYAGGVNYGKYSIMMSPSGGAIVRW